jgi:MFS family permease
MPDPHRAAGRRRQPGALQPQRGRQAPALQVLDELATAPGLAQDWVRKIRDRMDWLLRNGANYGDALEPLAARIFLPFAAGYYFSYFLRNVNAVIAPELTRELGVSAADLGLLTSAYLLAFGAVQLPLGLALDRYGARRVEAFAAADRRRRLRAVRRRHVADRTGGGAGADRARRIGLLMASFKAFSQWFGTERQASLNAAIMAAGGLGALTASTPLAWAIPQFGWRAVFVALAVAGLAVAVAIFSTPEKPAVRTGRTLAQPGRRPGRSPHQPRLLALRARNRR